MRAEYPDLDDMPGWCVFGTDETNLKAPAGVNGRRKDWQKHLATKPQAEAALKRYSGSGLGFRPGTYGDVTVVAFDLDQAAYIEGSKIVPRRWAQPILKAAREARLYVARSTGKHGYHIIGVVDGPVDTTKLLVNLDLLDGEPPVQKDPKGIDKTPAVEPFSAAGNRANYIALSGRTRPGSGSARNDATPVLDVLASMLAGGDLGAQGGKFPRPASKRPVGAIMASPIGVVNAVALSNGEALFPHIFPDAEDRGDSFMAEDGAVALAWHASGMKDFATGEGRSFVDVLNEAAHPEYHDLLADEYQGAENPKQAALLVLKALCDINVDVRFLKPMFRGTDAFGAVSDGPVDLLAAGTAELPQGEFPAGILPQSVEAFAKAVAASLGVQVNAVQAAALLVAAACIPAGVTVSIGATDKQGAAVWVLVVGNPGSGKTPLLNILMQSLRDIDAREGRAWRSHMAKRAKRARLPGLHEETPPVRPAEPPDACRGDDDDEAGVADITGPFAPRLADDVTIQAVMVKMENATRGVIIDVDELQSLLGNLASFSKDGGGSAQSFLNAAYTGRPYKADRIGRDPVDIPRCHLSIVSGMQPLELTARISSLQSNGFAQRFVMVPLGGKKQGDYSLSDDDASIWERIVTRLLEFRKGDFKLSARAKTVFLTFTQEEEASRSARLSNEMKTARSKSGELVQRIALALHMLHWAAGGKSTPQDLISEKTMQAAVNFVRRYHWANLEWLDEETAGGEAREDVVMLARRVLSLFAKGERRVTNEKLREAVRAFKGRVNWDRYVSARNKLVDAGWLIQIVEGSDGSYALGDLEAMNEKYPI